MVLACVWKSFQKKNEEKEKGTGEFCKQIIA